MRYKSESLLGTCQTGTVTAIEKFSDDSFQERGVGGATPLMIAISSGSKEIAKWLLEHNKAELNSTDNSNETALITALRAERYRDEFVQMLLASNGIDLHVQSYFWGTALTYAIFSSQFDYALQLLSKESSFQIAEHPGALHWAVVHGNKEIVLTLINLKVDLNTTKYANFVAPDDWVWKSMPFPAPFAFREDDTTPLLVAVEAQNLELVDLLLKNGADPNFICANKAPLLAAADSGDQKCIEILLTAGADLYQKIDQHRTIAEEILSNQYIDDKIKEFIKAKLPSVRPT